MTEILQTPKDQTSHLDKTKLTLVKGNTLLVDLTSHGVAVSSAVVYPFDHLLEETTVCGLKGMQGGCIDFFGNRYLVRQTPDEIVKAANTGAKDLSALSSVAERFTGHQAEVCARVKTVLDDWASRPDIIKRYHAKTAANADFIKSATPASVLIL